MINKRKKDKFGNRLIAFLFICIIFLLCYAFKNPIRALKQFHQSSKQNRVPSLSMIFKSLKHWSTLDYHPEHDGDVNKALAYLAKSHAARIAQAG